MRKKILFPLLIFLIAIYGCEVYEELKRGEDVITDFENLNLSQYLGQNITIQGISVKYPLFSTSHYTDTFYGLKDNNGFYVKFISRGGRTIDLGELYTIKGTVVQDNDTLCSIYSCNTLFFLIEVKP